MKTISLRELHNNTGRWVRASKQEGEIAITDRGVVIARLAPPKPEPKMKRSWKNRDLLPGYAALMNAGKLKTKGDSTLYISEDRTSRDNSVAGIEK